MMTRPKILTGWTCHDRVHRYRMEDSSWPSIYLLYSRSSKSWEWRHGDPEKYDRDPGWHALESNPKGYKEARVLAFALWRLS